MANLTRELFIGLGGTGGKVLRVLYDRMSDEQKKNAKYVFIDTDERDINELSIAGIKSIRISNADNVLRIAESFGQDDGVMDWLPNGQGEGEFLSSVMDDGASQCRFKSRLCLARFFKQGAVELKELLDEMTRPGIALQDGLRIVIVSSIAGGTGAGTFIQMALYVRKYFRDLTQDAKILGILSLPDLYESCTEDEIKRKSMFANAYAAIRELNAMNLATNPEEDPRGPQKSKGKKTERADRMLKGYGSKINLKIATKSEGVLFDSKDLSFQMNVKAKPFDQIYFVDKANEEGGILRDLNAYYRIMSDIAYSRLYSPLNGNIASGESNEMRNHTAVPTAIYGSAGYAQIVYPYKEIREYLAEHKLHQDLDSQWVYFDELWDSMCEMERDLARMYGSNWTPKPGLRGKKFIEDVNTELRKEKTNFSFLNRMIFGKAHISKTQLFEKDIAKAAKSLENGDQNADADNQKSDADRQSAAKSALFNNENRLATIGGAYSVLRDSDVRQNLASMIKTLKENKDDERDPTEIYNALLSMSKTIENSWSNFAASLETAARAQAHKLSAAILPISKVAVENHKASPISLKYALLRNDDGKAVHPLAARYLLYGLQEKCLTQGSSVIETLQTNLDNQLKKLNFALDDDYEEEDGDGVDLTVEMAIEESAGGIKLRSRRLADARELREAYKNKAWSIIEQALKDVDAAVVNGAYAELTEPVKELIKLYEGFFGEILPYRDRLGQRVHTDSIKHDRGGNQIIYVGASSEIKRLYTVNPTVVAALSADPDATYAAAGSGVYDVLFELMRTRLEKKRQARALGTEPQPESFDCIDGVFDSILQKYQDLLEENDTAIKTDVIGAIVNDIFADCNLSSEKINNDPAARQRFDSCFAHKIADLCAKSKPMVRYNERNSKNYYLDEVENNLLNVSTTYCHFGISPASAESIHTYFGFSDDPLADFRSRMHLGNNNNTLLVDNEYKSNVMFCFSAVHCLQPTQIYHFLEDQDEGSYYPCYKERIESSLISDNPHLDKRWGPHGAMPFISPNLELRWRKVVMKALIYEALFGRIHFTVDRDNNKRFIRTENDALKFLSWPGTKPILVREISRLVEYLAEDEEQVKDEADELDKLIERFTKKNYNYYETPKQFKQGMTKDKLLTLLRKDLLSFLQTDKAVKGGKTVDADDDDPVIEVGHTLGGILHVAFLMHHSEERLGEDKDYGEALIETAAEIIDKYALGMHGEAQAFGSSELHKEYVEIYNWAIEKFMEDWLAQAKVDSNLLDEPEKKEEKSAKKPPKSSNRLQVDFEQQAPTTKTKRDVIPDQILRTPEYIWIKNNWKMKPFQDED